MATSLRGTRLALRPNSNFQPPHGAWWPETRSLNDQLTHLFDLWPPGQGKIARILYSPPDWDDHPRSVPVSGRRVKTGSFPRDDTHLVTLVLNSGQRRTITVIPPQTSRRKACNLLDKVAGDGPEAHAGWENEGGHVWGA
jgi:hypothetical protein